MKDQSRGECQRPFPADGGYRPRWSPLRRRWLWVGAALAMTGTTAGAQAPQHDPPHLQAFLFGDVRYVVTDGVEGAGFELGQMVAHGNATLSERVVFFGEVSVTPRESGFALAMERLILRYDFSDLVKLSGGRYHTPISYWNTEYHHGLWLQASVSRPEAVKFGSRYIPVHFVGAMVEGNLHEIPLYYAVGFGNGRSTDLASAGDAGDVNDTRAIVASASLRPRGLFGFRIGGAAYVDRLADSGGDVADELIVSAHVVWDRGRVEAAAEYIHVSHTELATNVSRSSPSYYVHAGYRLGGALRQFTPYARIERMSIDGGDPVFIGVVDDYEGAIVGLRWDFDGLAALKAEYRRESFGAGGRENAFHLQASFAIPVAGGVG